MRAAYSEHLPALFPRHSHLAVTLAATLAATLAVALAVVLAVTLVVPQSCRPPHSSL